MRQSDLFIKSTRPWNAGRMIGPKAPLKPKHIWAIRQQLKVSHRIRDLAMFNCALDSKLRGCDLVRLRVGDVAPGGAIRQRSTVIQQKTGRPVPFEITEPARNAIAAWLAERADRDGDWVPRIIQVGAPHFSQLKWKTRRARPTVFRRLLHNLPDRQGLNYPDHSGKRSGACCPFP